jgi:hypothetical protein
MLGETEDHPVRDRCEAVLRQNWREGTCPSDGVAYAYTCPSPGRYPWQWYWDSCFHAIAWRRFDPSRPERELRSLLAAQRADGFIGHTVFWKEPLRGTRRLTYNVTSPDALMTDSIQPPLLAWAWQIAVGDPAQEPGILRHMEWLAAHRDLDGDGLLWIVSPDESGLDASPQFDAVWGRRAHGRPGYLRLVRRNRRLGFDMRRILADGGPLCCEVTTNVLYNLSRLSLGLPSLTPVLIDRCYDERDGVFLPQARPRAHRRPATTIAALSPLALPDLPKDVGRRLVEEHLLNPARFWTPVPPPSVSAAEASFSVRDTGWFHQRRYWRGPTWINTAWLCWLGLVRLGYDDAAAELGQRLAATMVVAGVREYYNPYTGAGMGARDFGWSTLVLEMLEPLTSPAWIPSARST